MMREEDRGGLRLSTNRLLLHDLRIAAHHLRATFSNIADGATAVVVIGAMLGFGRHGVASLDPFYRQIAVALAASVLGLYVHVVVARRLAFFRSDSVLADLALDPAVARRYGLVIAILVGSVLPAALLLPDWTMMLGFVAGFAISLLLAAFLTMVIALLRTRISHQRQRGLDQLVGSRHVAAGLPSAAAVGAALVLVVGRLAPVNAGAAAAMVVSAALGLWYAPVAYAAIDFERLIGLSPLHSLRIRLVGLVILAAALTGAAALTAQWQVVAIVAAVFALLLLYKAMEILVVRAIGTAKAKIAMIVMLFGLASIALVVPFLIPPLIAAAAWWLVAAGRRRRWQIA